MRKNLKAILDRAKARNVPVMLAGMEAPPNFGPDYTREFRSVYADLAKEYQRAASFRSCWTAWPATRR